MKNLLLISTFFGALTAFAQDHLTLKTTSAFKHPVVFQTGPTFMKSTAKSDIYRKFYITRWGTQRFEFGYIDIKCTTKKCSFVGEETRLAFYEKCTGFNKNLKPICTGLIASDDSDNLFQPETSSPWYQCDDMNGCNNQSPDTDFPVREGSDMDSDSSTLF